MDATFCAKGCYAWKILCMQSMSMFGIADCTGDSLKPSLASEHQLMI